MRNLFCGPLRDSTAPQPRRTVACFSHTSYSLWAARRCRFCRPPSRRTIASRGRVPPGAPVLFPEFWIKPQGRLFKGHGYRDRENRALARRHMAPAAENANFPGPDSWIGRAPVTIRCRNARLRAHSSGSRSYCYVYCRAGACVSQRRTRADTTPPRLNFRSRC